ncbi:MAG: ClbS/DfsB family four-helix bundle protein [Sulfitobacter sp.]
MPAKTKSDLMNVTDSEFAKLQNAITGTDAGHALLKDNDGTSIKDIVAHRAHWIALFLGCYTDGQADKEVFFPARGYRWNELPRYNADLRAQQVHLGWDAATNLLLNAHSELRALLDRSSDQDLYAAPMKGAKNAWTMGRWAEAAGPSHYRSATKYIRQRNKAHADL